MRLGRLANLLTVIGVVLALAGAATALAAARAPDPGTTAPAPVARSSVHSVTNAPEADGASGRAPEPAPRVSADPASTISETGIPRKAATPPDSPIASSFVKNGPAVAVAVLETVNPSVPVEGPDLRIGTGGAARAAAGRNGAGPVFQQTGITSYDITLKPGSNLISLTLMPDDTAIEAVLAGILDRVEMVWQYETSGPDPKWRSYAPGAPSDLRVMRDGPGYWVHLKDDGTGDEALTITGGDASGPARRVVQGWNLVGFTATTAGDAATDRAALAALYNATDGANWLNNRNWLSNGPMGEWHGVTTDSDGRVTHLDLRHNQLTGEIPEELGNLSNLTGLSLGGNQLTGEIPAELGSLANLQWLHLDGNQLSGEIPAELGSLTDLEELFLSGNQLTGCIPVGIAGVANNDFNQLGLPFCAGASGAPTIGTLTPGADFLTITWAAPTGSTESAIIAYDLRYIESAARDKSDVNWTVVDNAWTAGSGALSYQITGLTGGAQYDVQVRAVSAAGDGPWSATAPGTPATWGAIRSFSPPSVAPAGEVVVMITASGYGWLGAVTETLPPGFSYVSSSLEDSGVTDVGREVRFSLFGQTAFTYTVTAPSAEGTYSFSGVLRDSDREDVPVGGALTIAVAAGDPLIVRYDANGNGMIEKNEVIAAINNYLFGEGDEAISKSDVIKLINLYLFG